MDDSEFIGRWADQFLDPLPDPFRRTMIIGRPVTYVIDREGYVRRFIKGAGTYVYFESLIQPYLGDNLAVR